jgi:hypothetical protein
MQDNQNSGRYFSQEELDAIVSGAVVPKMPTDLGAPQEAAGSSPVWDTADTLMAVPRGAVGAAKGVWNFADWATFDLLPDWHTNPLGSSKSIVGGFVEGIAQVGTGMLVGGGVLGAVSKIPGAVGTAASWLGGAGGGAAGVVRSGLSKGVIADFVAFEAHDARLSDLLVQADNPLLNNVVTQYLASDMEDGELEGRLKNALEGGVTGVALDGVVSLLKGSVKASKNYRAAKAAGRSEEEAVKAAMDAGASDIRRGESVLSKEQDNLLTKAEFERTGGAGAELKEAEELLARADDEASLEVMSAGRVGGPNYKVNEVRATAVDPNVAKEMKDILAGGGDRTAIRDAVKRYDDAGLINFNRILRGQGTDEELYEELVGVLRQFEANPRSFSKAPKGSNKATSDAAKAALLAMQETGGVNIAAMRAMVEKGTITAKEVFDLAPVLEGVEMHLRSKMLEALRNPSSADPVLMAKAWTSIAGSVEKFFSYAGKTLQVRQAFDTSKRFMDELSRLSPEQQKIMAESMADTLQYLVLDPKTGKEMAKVLTESSMMKGVRIITELHRNSILSGPKTAAVNFWNGVQMLLQPVERAVGRLGSGQTDIAARELSTITRYMGESREAARAAAASFIAEGDSITLGRGNTQFGEFSPQRAVSSRNARFLNTVDPATGGVNRTVAGTAVDFVGQVVGTPTRLMGTSDEFFTTLSARSEADVVLRRIVAKNMKRGLTDSAVSAEVHRLKQIMFVDGQLYTRKTVLERGMRMAREKYLPKALLKTLSDSIAAKTGASATDPSVVSEANRMFSQMIDPSTGKVKSMAEIRKMPDADVLIPSLDAAGGRAVAEPLFLSEVQRFVDQNWDQYVDSDMMPIGGRFQDQVGQDFRILQQASREIERRVRETTWKRDYEDMAESSVWGTRLVGNIGRAVSGAVNQVPALQLVVPFIRTPTNLLAYVTDRNPVGRSLAWVQAARAGDKEAMAEAIGRFSTGTVFYTTAVALAANGMITGKGPKDTELRKQLLAAGWQPYSFRIGDTFLSYGRNDPVATFFGLVADTFEVANATYDPTPDELGAMETLSKAILTSVANNVTTKSYLRGISTVIEALGGNEAAIGQLKRQYAGAVVPNFLAQGENYVLDSDIRETRTMLDAIRARTPFLNDNVDKVRNATGDPISGAEGPFSMWLPTTARRLSKDPVKQELASSLISVGSPRRVLPGGIDLKNIRLKSGQSAYDRLQELSGEVRIGGRTLKQQLQSLISSPFYQGLPEMGQDNFDSPRVSLVRGNVSSFRRAAMQQLMKESPDLAVAVAKSREAKASMFR